MEDFVTFELAKKLKEKGFNRMCLYAYCEKGGWNMYKQVHEPITHILRTNGNPFGSFCTGENWNVEYKTNKNKIRCSAPTISQVFKWLREEKDIDLVINPVFFYDDVLGKIREYECRVFALSLNKPEHCGYHGNWEQAVLAGIEYVLNNLI